MNRNVLTMLEDVARRLPDKPAIIDEYGVRTFSELRDQARRIGCALAAAGLAGKPTVILLEKGADALAAMMGVLYAGGCYVPIDPVSAPARLEPILEALQKPAIIAGGETRALAAEHSTLDVHDLMAHDLDERALTGVRFAMVDTDPAYILFTSGSTGTPKGVVVPHRAIFEFITTFTELFGITEDDVIANQAPFDFDVSVKDIYSALAVGATLSILPRRLFAEPATLVRTLIEHQVTTLTWAVAALCLVTSLHALDGIELSGVRRVLFSGETMPLKHLATWLECAPNATFVNLYGPTEVTCNCLFHTIDRARDYSDGIPLGAPFPNHQVLVLDEEQHPVAGPGAVGEVYVRTPELALGYIADAARTAEAFVQNPCNSWFPDTVYRTGDLVRVTASGELVFCGRRDNQIKHLGHRIELEEIDHAIERVPDVTRCRCAYDSRRHRIYAFYEGAVGKDELARTVQRELPAHLAPNVYVPVDGMPLTKNGKVDRRALLDTVTARKRDRGARARS